MSDVKVTTRPGSAYEADYVAWAEDQAARLRRARPAGVDWENLAEEVESLGKSDRRAIGANLKLVLDHLIKWRFQPAKRSASWSTSIDEHRDRIARILADSPSLAGLPAAALAAEYRKARRKALADTGLPSASVPERCPFAVADVLDPDFLPGESRP